MIEQVVVVHQIERSVLKEAIHVAGQRLAVAETVHKAVYHVLLGRCEPERIYRVNGREVCVKQLILLFTDFYHSALKVNLIQQVAVLHMELRMAGYHRSLYLELDYGYGLVHL